MVKIVTAAESAKIIPDGAVVTVSSSSGLCCPDAVLKAIGTRRTTLIRMIVVQGVSAGLISYGIGVGLAALASLPGRSPDAQLASWFPWQLLIVALVPMLLCVMLGSMISLRRVMRLDPVVVFK